MRLVCTTLSAALAGVLCASAAQAQSIAYLMDLRNSATTSRWINFPVDAPALNVTTTTGEYRGFAMDFNNLATVLYGIDNRAGNQLGTIDPISGSFNLIAPISGDGAGVANWTGMTVGPDNSFWLSSADTLFTLDPATGVTTMVGMFGAAGIQIDIAMDSQGNMYGHNITDDSLYSIDTTTGVATLIGPTGMAANFAQGMDFDWETDTLYAPIYTGGGTGAWGWFDLSTGAFNTIMSTTAWNIEAEVAIASPIPEPATLGLLGLAGLALVRRRR